jgi:hypothetical protein
VKNLKPCAGTYNKYVNSSTGFTPKQAIALSSEEQKELRINVKKSQKESDTPPPPDLKAGTRVRIKIPKGKLDKMGTPNWRPDIHKLLLWWRQK